MLQKHITEITKYQNTVDVVADVTKGLSFQYTGNTIHVSKDKVTVTESKSENNGADDKLGGADLSSAFKDAVVDGKMLIIIL